MIWVTKSIFVAVQLYSLESLHIFSEGVTKKWRHPQDYNEIILGFNLHLHCYFIEVHRMAVSLVVKL